MTTTTKRIAVPPTTPRAIEDIRELLAFAETYAGKVIASYTDWSGYIDSARNALHDLDEGVREALRAMENAADALDRLRDGIDTKDLSHASRVNYRAVADVASRDLREAIRALPAIAKAEGR